MEQDPLGELPVPAAALYGVQTERARQNFPISHLAPLAPFIDAVIRIKKAAALTHKETGRLEAKLADRRPPRSRTRRRDGSRPSSPTP